MLITCAAACQLIYENKEGKTERGRFVRCIERDLSTTRSAVWVWLQVDTEFYDATPVSGGVKVRLRGESEGEAEGSSIHLHKV